MSVEAERYIALAANAHIDRKYAPMGDTVPTIDELESLASRVERLNTEGSTTEFIDAQSGYIDALTVALEWQASRNVDAEVATLTAQLQAAQATIARALDRLQEPVHPYGDQTIPKVPEIDFIRDAYGDIADDIKVILSRADTSALAEHDHKVAEKALMDAAYAIHVTRFDKGNGGPDNFYNGTITARNLVFASIEQTEAE